MKNLQCLTCGKPFKSRKRDARYCSHVCKPSNRTHGRDRRPLLCEICKQPETVLNKRTGKPIALSFDHDHITGKFRGFICVACNHGLGVFKDNIETLKTAIDYLILSRG